MLLCKNEYLQDIMLDKILDEAGRKGQTPSEEKEGEALCTDGSEISNIETEMK
uniref:Uncharacterized protein n=1 Tax=Solanum lycopersicum TaxID=4081 RepID=A0A3Q7EV21_SOLLC